MFAKFRKQNWIVLTIFLVLLIVSIIITVFFANFNYIRFKEIFLKNQDIILDLYSRNLKNSFQNISDNLLTLSNLSCMKSYLDSNFESEQFKSELIKSLTEAINNNISYLTIKIINGNGNEKISVSNRSIPDTNALKNYLTSSENEFFINSYNLEENEINLIITNIEAENTNEITVNQPILKMSAPLFNSAKNKIGIIIVDINLKNLLQTLPDNIFIQTNDGYIIEIQQNGNLSFKKSQYDLISHEGTYEISKLKEIHYQKVEYFNKEILTIGLIHDHSELNKNLTLILLSSSLLSFLLFSTFISYFIIIYSRFKNVIDANKTIVFALARLSEYRDEITGKHLEKVSKYSIVLGKELSKIKKFKKIITEEYIKDLKIAVILHDIGKVGIRDSILLKEGKLNVEEFEEIKKHVLIGEEIINEITKNIKINITFFSLGKNIIKYHHEKFDGTGYPFKLKGNDIPLEARIFSIIDSYDTIRSKRPYKNEISHEEALNRIITEKGKHFDPEIVDAFIRCNQTFNKISSSLK